MINIKLVRVGVLNALDIIQSAKDLEMKLMMGAMVETRLGCGFAAHLVSVRSIFELVDLDTASLLSDDPTIGGPSVDGLFIRMSKSVFGHGVQPVHSG